MNKHTATPWTWRGHADSNGLCHINSAHRTIVQVWDFPEAEANAAFICKAVNEYKANQEKIMALVKALREAKAAILSAEELLGVSDMSTDAIAHAREALKLAEGRG